MRSWFARNLTRRRIAQGLLVGVLILAFVATAPILARKPRNGRNWADYAARTATATFNPDGSVTLHNVRDWTYSDTAILTGDWTERTVDPASVTGVFFLVEPISAKSPIAHTFLSFRLKDGSGLSFSVEARLLKGQTWKPIEGALRNYELAYQWGTDRDFVAARVLYLHNWVRLYPAVLKPQLARRLFVDLVGETNDLARRPRFYNTLTDNCTNTLAYIINRHAPHTLPWSPSWYLTGRSDAYLMKQGFISTHGGSVERTRAEHDLTPYRARIRAMAGDPPDRFSAELAALPPAQP